MNNKELNEQLKVLIEKNGDFLAQTKVLKDQLQVKHVVIDTHVECQEKYAKLEAERYEYMIRYFAYFNNDKQHKKQIVDQEVLYDKMSVQLVKLDKHVRDLKNTVLEKDFKISKLEECARIVFKSPHYFEKAKDLRPSLYDEKVIGLAYTPMFLTHFDEALEIEKFKRARENKIEFAYDNGSLNASYQTSSLKPYVPSVILEKIITGLEDEVVSLLQKEKENLKTIESLKSNDVETGVLSSEKVVSETKNQRENYCQVVEKECDNVENSKVIAPGMFKLSVSQSVSPISVTKTSCASNGVESTLKIKRRKRKSSKQHDKQVNEDMRKGSSNTIKADLSTVNHSSLNKNVTRYSCKNLMACNNSKTRSAFDCNNARNALCNARMNASVDVNDLFIFDDVSIRKSHVSKMPFRKNPRDSMNVRSKNNSNKSLPRTVHRWLPKMQPLVEPVAKWIPKIVQICLWIIDSRCSKHMTGNRALLTDFVEKFLGTVRFGNNDFAVIDGYGDVVIG
nr:retrovirus-related Pol polyprotein from transposon TNT 1-94 [Tanacetum cinerariifolium]